jgi:uncharacterized phage protein (TIGR01671 family)
MTKHSENTQTATCDNAVLANRLCFRVWIESTLGNYMAVQGEPDLETLGSFMHHYSDCKNIMQFTGLLDKNGNKIFEGDIVTYKRSVGNWTGQTMTTTHKIIFTEEVNAFVMDYGSSYIKLRKHWGYEYEVIGNIFENPDLLQGVL